MEWTTTGPIISEDEFNMCVLIPNVMKTVKEYGIEYDPGNPVPSDDGFVNRLFERGIEFLAKTGVYCDAINRIIHLDRGEIVRAIENLPEGRAFGGPGNGASSSRGGLGMEIPRGVMYGRELLPRRKILPPP